MRRSPPGKRRGGYTLLEVLIALGLSMVLLSAVYASLSLYWKYSVAGQDEIQQAQLARSILRQIEIDLRSVVYHAATASSSSGTSGGSSSTSSGSSTSSNSSTSGSSSGSTSGSSGSSGSSTSSSSSSSTSGSSSSSTSGSTTETAPDAALTSTSSGLFGNATTLLVHVSRPSRTELYGTIDGGQSAAPSRMSDLQSIVYYVTGQGGGALQGAVNSPGLARMAGDRLLMQMADQQGNTSAMAANTKILAPEVTSITFYYYDGTNWLASWDSGTLGALPKAVEVILELAPTDVKKPATINSYSGTNPLSNAGTNQIYRLIVALPAAKLVISTTQ